MCDKDKFKEIEKQIERKDENFSNESFHDSLPDAIHENYQPEKSELDDNNPPDDE
jgi:hypothetical protein